MNIAIPPPSTGIIYTFYSYKGGVGRSMALANCAALLAKWGSRVLVVDWDLEAPGLERFFSKFTGVVDSRSKMPGVLDLIESWRDNGPLHWKDCRIAIPIANGSSRLDLITAGQLDHRYSSRLHSLDFSKLFEESRLGNYIEELRDEWIANYDFVLLDSRTGVTDIGGICTVHLADILILLFTTTDSSLNGIRQIIDRARQEREKLPVDRTSLVAVPVPARDESRTEYRQSQDWKRISAERFQDLYEDWLPQNVSASDAVNILRIPYIPYWSFGEKLPVLEEDTRDPSSIGHAYETLSLLIANRLDWTKIAELDPHESQANSSDNASLRVSWLQDQEKKWDSLFSGWIRDLSRGRSNVKAYYSCSKPLAIEDQQELLTLAGQVQNSGQRIGQFISSSDSKPKPMVTGIQARIEQERSLSFWAFNLVGDFFQAEAPITTPDGKFVFLNERIRWSAELLSHAYKFYKKAGIPDSGQIDFVLKYEGLAGKVLTQRDSPEYAYSSVAAEEDSITIQCEFTLRELKLDFTSAVESLSAPLFRLFDFQKFARAAYEYHSGHFSNLD
jgi:cellulose biosynthesis protein BcsQ